MKDMRAGGGEMERTASRGQGPRQEEGIPSPSFQDPSDEKWSEGTPQNFYFSTARETWESNFTLLWQG